MEPNASLLLPTWISFFSHTYLLGSALVISLTIIFIMFFILHNRACLDWYLLLFTTLSLFVLLMLFPLIQSSRLAAAEVEEYFLDIDRPWTLILTYVYSSFILSAATLSMGYMIEFMEPNWKGSTGLAVLRLLSTLMSLSLPLIDVGVEWVQMRTSSHCLDGVCRWFLLRKDASLCILLLLWSLSVSITLLSANLGDAMNRLHAMRKERKTAESIPIEPVPTESELAYRRQVEIEKQRIAEIRRKRSGTTGEETVPLTTRPPSAKRPASSGTRRASSATVSAAKRRKSESGAVRKTSDLPGRSKRRSTQAAL